MRTGQNLDGTDTALIRDNGSLAVIRPIVFANTASSHQE